MGLRAVAGRGMACQGVVSSIVACHDAVSCGVALRGEA